FFENNYGVRISNADYAKMVETAIANDYDTFEAINSEFISNTFPNAKKQETPAEKRRLNTFLREFHQRQGSKIPQRSKENPNGKYSIEVEITKGGTVRHVGRKGSTRLKYHNELLDSDIKEEDYDLSLAKEIVTGMGIREYEFSDFVHEEGVADTQFLSIEDIGVGINGKNGKFWVESTEDVNSKVIAAIENRDKNIVFVASKSGDHSSVLFTTLTEDIKDMTLLDIVSYFEKEISLGNMTHKIVNTITEKVNKGSLHFLQREVAKHEWWKNVKYPQYLLGTHIGTESHQDMNILDQYNRLSLDFTSTFTLRGLGESSIMTVDTNTSVILDKNGNKVMDLLEVDGWLLSSGRWFSKVGDLLGYNNLSTIKGAIRGRVDNGNNNVDYIGVKSMQMRAFTGMQIANKDGNVIAKYVGNGKDGHWIDPNDNNKVFDHLSPTDTSKMTNGKYSEFNKVHSLPDGHQKITFLPKEKDSVAYPVTHGELLMDKELLDSKEGKALHKELSSFYKSISDDYLERLKSFLTDPMSLKKELEKSIDENDILPELQKIVKASKNGKGLLHSAVSKMWIENILSKFIRGGFFKAKDIERGVSTSLFYKPLYNPAFGSLEFKEDDFAVSAENKVIRNVVEAAFLESNDKEAYKNLSFFDKIGKLNDWLAEKDGDNYKNNVKVLLSRQPINKVTGVVLRNVRHLKPNSHGQVMFLSHRDVIEVFDGDWDGDKGMIVSLDKHKKLLKAYDDFQKSDAFKSKNKVVDLLLWGKQFVETRLYVQKDVNNAVDTIANSRNKIGMIQNARITLLSMSYKNFKIEFKDGSVVVPFEQSDRVIMDYKSLDVDNMTPEMFEQAKNNGDKFIALSDKKRQIKTFKELKESKFKVFLETTKGHEMSILLQMAVDDTKFGLLGAIKLDNNFLIKRMFKLENGNTITQKHIKALASVKSQFNFSPYRQGIDKITQDKFDLAGIFEMSENLSLFGEAEYRKFMLDSIQNDSIDLKNPDANLLPTNIEYDFDKKTPQENILLSLSNFRDEMFATNNSLSKSIPFTYNSIVGRASHWTANAKLIKAITNTDFWKKAVVKYSNKDKKIAEAFAEGFAEGFYPIVKKDREIKDIKELKYSADYNEDINSLIDKFLNGGFVTERGYDIIGWKNMTEHQKILSTIIALTGTRVGDNTKGFNKNIKAFLSYELQFPIAMLHQKTYIKYLELWHDAVVSGEMNSKTIPKSGERKREVMSLSNLFLEAEAYKDKIIQEKACG
ncbi:MAG: hypothetical protein H8E55_29335, partial [Pelagibacterales bacterium]|nr:hypothetical protein [Pelagibacterales bacterium]